MKRLTLIIIGVLLCTPLYSDMNTYIAGVPVSGGGDTCTGSYGETADGSINAPAGAGFTWIIRTALDCSALANDTTFNIRLDGCSQDAREVVFLIYEDNAGEPGDLIWQSSAHYWVDNTTPQTKTDTVTSALSGSYVWIGFHFESADSRYFYTSNSPARTTRTITNAGSFPDIDSAWDTANDATNDYGFNCYLSY